MALSGASSRKQIPSNNDTTKEKNAMRRPLTILLYVLATLGTANASLAIVGQANLYGNSYNLIYDANSPFGPIVYLDYSKNSSTWIEQSAWVLGLNNQITATLDSNSGLAWSGDWRLPILEERYGTGFPPDYGYSGEYNLFNDSKYSELGHLYFTELGNKAYIGKDGLEQSSYGLLNSGPFNNLLNDTYWTGTPRNGGAILGTVDGVPVGGHWQFEARNGSEFTQFDFGNSNWGSAIAVRNVIPEPESLTLVLVGLGLVSAISRRNYNIQK